MKYLLPIVATALFAVSTVAEAKEHLPDTDVVTAVEDQLTPTHWSRLPLLGDKAREKGYDLPLPIGISVFFTNIDAPYRADNDFMIQVEGGAFGELAGGNDVYIPKDDVEIQGEDDSVQVKIDAWVLPFLNIYALAGKVDGGKDITASLANVQGLDCNNLSPRQRPACKALANNKESLPDLPIPIEYEAKNWGVGAVLGGQIDVVDGWNPFIVTAIGSFIKAKTNTTDSTIKTTIGQFRVGQRYDVRGDKIAWFLAYQYQNIQQNVTGSYSFRGTQLEPLFHEVDYDIDLAREETHNMSISTMYEFGDKNQWNLYAEYGFLNWDQLTIGFGYRF